MTEALASRAAGLKLGAIVAVLLLPMLVLSYFMVGSLRQSIELTQREIVGMELNNLVIPILLGAASSKLDDADVQRFRRDGRALANELAVRKPYDTVLASLLTYGSDQRYSVVPLTELMIDSATTAGIIVDPVAESNHLGAVIGVEAPELLKRFALLATIAERTLRDGKIDRNEAKAMLLAIGAWEEAIEPIEASIKAARGVSNRSGSYDPLLEIMEDMSEYPAEVVKVLEISTESLTPGQMESFGAMLGQKSRTFTGLSTVMEFARTGLSNMLNDRLANLRSKLFGLLGLAAVACLIGVGGAGLMFQSTLKQLDGVKQSRDQAEAARQEAELAAQEVQRINDEAVRLNTGLARNFEMLRESQDENMRKSRMAQLGQLTATVAHELRNPLGAVRTSAFLLERKVRGKGLGIEAQLDRINNGVTRCDNIISQLLDFARTKTIQPESIVFDDWIAKLVEEEAQGLPPEISIECDLTLGGSAQAFDPARMRRALINLMSNASEALTAKADGTTKTAVKSPLIVIATRLTARGVEFSVADNGPGIAPENAEKIFEPLFTTKNFGTGLGLPAVQKIMEQHGGGLEVQSSPGQGATFVAWWPAANPDVLAA